MSNLKIQNDSEDEDNSSIETVVQNVKKEDVPQTAAPCPPIPGGQVYDENHPPRIESTSKLGPTEETIQTEASSSSSLLSTRIKMNTNHKSFMKGTEHAPIASYETATKRNYILV